MTRLPDQPEEQDEQARTTGELSWPDISRPTVGYGQRSHRGGDVFPGQVGDSGEPGSTVRRWPFVVVAALVVLGVVALVGWWLV